MADDSWYVYVVRCCDDTLYTGISTDPTRRVHEHNGTRRGARYTRARRPVELVAVWEHCGQSAASKAEYDFKQLCREEKLSRIRARQEESCGSID